MIAGFARCGSTFLAQALATNSQLFVAGQTPPEPKALLGWKGNINDIDETYARVFAAAPIGAKLVEKSTSYSDHLETCSMLRRLYPETRVIFVVRDPVERILSNYYWSLQNRLETRSLNDAMSELLLPDLGLPREPRPQDYLWRSLYGNHLHTWLRYWPREQLFVCQFERLIIEGSETLSAIAHFLGIEDSFTFNGPVERVNSAQRSTTKTDIWQPQMIASLETLTRSILETDIATLVKDWPHIDVGLWPTYLSLLSPRS